MKQEIAKEGILPFSRFFAGNTTTLFAKIWSKLYPQKAQQQEELEKSPTAALLLHWTFSVLLIAFTSGETAAVAYRILVDLYTYVIMLLVSFFVATGLLYLRFHDARGWREMSVDFKPWGGPTAALFVRWGNLPFSLYSLIGNSIVTGFLLVTAFIPPADDSPFSNSTQGYEWYIVPTVGLGGLILGGVYFVVFRYVVPQVKGKQLIVERVPIIVSDDHGGFVQKHEIVEFSWGVPEASSDYEMKWSAFIKYTILLVVCAYIRFTSHNNKSSIYE